MSVILITGADGFIGRNLRLRLGEIGGHEVIGLGRGHSDGALAEAAARAEFVYHLAGVNRPKNRAEFTVGNVGFTKRLCAALVEAGNRAPIAYASSIQAEADNPYGASKRAAEEALLRHAEAAGSIVNLFRLPNVFGKWARPNYNSVVATFCHQIVRGETVTVHDAAALLRLIYIDDVVDAFVRLLNDPADGTGFRTVEPVYTTTVGEIADIIRGFRASRETLVCPRVGTGLVRALYSTYLTYLAPEDFAYRVPIHGDSRGVFVEMLKTPDTGQISYFTAGPGVTRGNHYHHSKAEKFLVVAGTAHFGFRHMATGQRYEVVTQGGEGKIVETIPGWAHNITNVGEDELVVLLWANEIFDRARPDTVCAEA